jgi:hypothetical protein
VTSHRTPKTQYENTHKQYSIVRTHYTTVFCKDGFDMAHQSFNLRWTHGREWCVWIDLTQPRRQNDSRQDVLDIDGKSRPFFQLDR